MTSGAHFQEKGLKYLLAEQCFDAWQHLLASGRRLETLDYIALTIDEELGEIPLDVGRLAPTWHVLVEHTFKQWGELMICVEAYEGLL